MPTATGSCTRRPRADRRSRMLRESPRIQQYPDQPRRRWFFSPYFDLVVWHTREGRVVGFHLLYDRTGDEKVFVWSEGAALRHFGVDDGERPGKIKMTPVLSNALPADAHDVAARFERESRNMDHRVAAFVLEKLRHAPPARRA